MESFMYSFLLLRISSMVCLTWASLRFLIAGEEIYSSLSFVFISFFGVEIFIGFGRENLVGESSTFTSSFPMLSSSFFRRLFAVIGTVTTPLPPFLDELRSMWHTFMKHCRSFSDGGRAKTLKPYRTYPIWMIIISFTHLYAFQWFKCK
jgi:hypothetical protein